MSRGGPLAAPAGRRAGWDSVRRVGADAAGRPVFGTLLRQWRQRRRVSQLDLAIAADVSARHVSFLETGRSRPSREMVLRLAERLEVPLRDRNPLLLAAGFAPSYPRRALDDPALSPVRDAVDAILAGYEPYPALVVDRSWTLVAANAGLAPLTAGAAGHLLAPPVNVLRLSLHPDGLAGRIANLAQWRGHVLARLAREAAAGADEGWPSCTGSWPPTPAAASPPAPSTPCSCRCGCGWAAGSCPSSARSRRSAPRWTSPRPS